MRLREVVLSVLLMFAPPTGGFSCYWLEDDFAAEVVLNKLNRFPKGIASKR